jgi:hypothetical protein
MVLVSFSDTILYAAEVAGGGPERGKDLHVLGYENTVQNGVGGAGDGGNAMLLPIPARPGTMTQRNCVSTKWCPRILQDYSLALFPPVVVYPRSTLGGRGVVPEARVEVFDSGIYTVVLAQDATAIPAALDRVPPAKRPTLNPDLFRAYDRWYAGWTFALCCFNNRHAARATPMLWWYEPIDPDSLFAPALDCHTGALPDLTADVDVDHTLVVGSYQMRGGRDVRFRDWFGRAANPYLVRRVIGDHVNSRTGAGISRKVQDDEFIPTPRGFRVAGGMPQKLPNGDFTFPLGDVRKGWFRYERVKPPGA